MFVRGSGFLCGHSPALDPSTLPLYHTIRDLVQDTHLWWAQEKRRRHLGYYCSHIYPHAAKGGVHFHWPDNLKGADMAMYAILRQLGLEVSFRPAFQEGDMGHSPRESTASSDEEEERRRRCPRELINVLGPDAGLEETSFYGGEEGLEREFNKWVGRTNQEVGLAGYLRYKDVHWVNGSGHKEVAATYMAVSLDLFLLSG